MGPSVRCVACRLAALTVCLICIGCARYTVPGGAADFAAMGVTPEERRNFTDPTIQFELDKKPLAGFPTGIAVARIQGSGYRSYSYGHAYGRGKYSVLTTRDVETQAHFEQIAGLPQVRGVAMISRMLLPDQLNDDHELRQAAAKLQADMLFVYTLDTVFSVDNDLVPLSVITLGLSPNEKARVRCTASGVLMDTRNGYLYGVVESTSAGDQLANAWTSKAAVDQVRRRVEAEAFDDLVNEFVRLWPSVVEQYASNPSP